jgi:hypothetical protein
MKNRNDENLKELFERFMGVEQAEKSLEDIRKGEQILREHPAPEPGDMLVADIKAEIAMRLPARRTYTLRKTAYWIAGAAAAVVLVSVIGLSLFDEKERLSEPPAEGLMLTTKVWVGDDIITDDQELANYAIEIEQIEQELRSLQSGEGAESGDSISELEMELVAINNDFWKE